MDEEKLQLWLAARLSDTPRRRFIPRFVVHREPRVDENKLTDIEVSSAAGKVCIEIKLLDTQRHYSANSLTDTMRNQLGGQYLRGRNSNHGILVLFRLDGKEWEIPESPARGDFNELIRYLQRQADVIKMHNAGIDDPASAGNRLCTDIIIVRSSEQTRRGVYEQPHGHRGIASCSGRTLGAKTP
jgi:hypothetical protein